MSLNTTNGAALLKKLYQGNALKDLTYKNRPFLSMIPKVMWKGSTHEVPLIYGATGAISATISTAITNKANMSSEVFSVPMRKHFGIASVDNEIIEKSKDDQGAFARALKKEVDVTINGVANALASMLFRAGGGAIGQVGSINAGSTVITLKNTADIHSFEKGMFIQADTVNGGGTVHSGSEEMTDIDRDLGTMTAADWTDMTGVAADDYLFKAGDYGLALDGLEGHIPEDAPGATAFHGVDRTSDVVRLAGVRVSAASVAGEAIEDRIQTACARLFAEGGAPDCCFLNPVDYRELVVSLGSKVIYDSDKATVGFNAVLLIGPAGPVKVVPDPWCQQGVAWVLQLNTWMMISTSGGLPKILDLDVGALREATADAYETRVGFYGNIGCLAPGWNARVDLT